MMGYPEANSPTRSPELPSTTPPEYGLAPCVDLAWSSTWPETSRRRRDNLFREEEFIGCNGDSRSGRKNMRRRSVMCTQVLTKARAVASIKGRVSLRKGAVRFRPPTSHRRIVLSNQDVS